MKDKVELGERKTIEYKGKTTETAVWEEITEEERQRIQEEYYTKPNFSDVQFNFKQLDKGGTNSNFISRYYVRDLMIKTILYTDKWCVEDIIASKDLLGCFMAKIHRNTDLFNPNDSLSVNLDKALQLGGGNYAHLPTNFPINTVDKVLERFNVNNNWYDMSCGWGNRLLGALKNKVNYFGTDPNYLLTERLQQMSKDWKTCRGDYSSVDIRTQGSEVRIPEWENKIGLCFTSPPYFYLEDYQIGNQSYKEGTSYESWLENFMRPTIQNCKFYLIDNGYMCINVKDFDKFALCEDIQKIAEQEGFVLMEKLLLEQNARINPNGEAGDSNEDVMVFMKRGFEIYFNDGENKEDLW